MIPRSVPRGVRPSLAGWALLALAASLAPTAATAQDEDSGDEAPERPALTPPRLIEAPRVTLPEDAEPLPPDSSLPLVITISAEGRVIGVQLQETLRDDVDTLVLEAAREMLFEPATRDGEPIMARVRFRFRITPPEPPPEEASTDGEDGPGDSEPGDGEPGDGEAAELPDPALPPEDTFDTSDMELDVPVLGVTAQAAFNRRSTDPRVGFVARRRFGATSARRISSANRSRAISRFRAWDRASCTKITSAPSLVQREPASRRSRAFTAGVSDGERSASNRSSTAVDTLFTF